MSDRIKDMEQKNGYETGRPGGLQREAAEKGSGEEQFTWKIERMTESLLSDWEISEDDFEDGEEAVVPISGTEAGRRRMRGEEDMRGNRRADGEGKRRTAAGAAAAGSAGSRETARPAGCREEHAGERRASSRRGNSDRMEHRGSGSGRSGQRRNNSAKSSRKRRKKGFLAFWYSLPVMDKVVGVTGIAVCLFALLTFFVVAGARSTGRQVEAFAQVGENLSGITVADEGTFLAVADGHMARQAAQLPGETESEEYNEKDDTSDVQVGLNMTSVEKDLKIKFVNRKTGKLIPYVKFEVEIKGPDKTRQKTDDDTDGIIYLTGLAGGNYTVRITGPSDAEGYVIPTDAQSVTVKNQIEYKKVDVSDEIKKESEVNAAKEDTEIKTQVESALQDTVEWVESTKTPIGGNGDSAYVEIKKSDIPDPAATASLDFARFAGIKSQSPALQALSGLSAWQGLLLKTESEPGSSEPAPSEPAPSEPESSEPAPSEPESSEPAPSTPESGEPSKPDKISVESVSLDRTSVSAAVGDTVQLSASVSPSNATDQSVSWSSGNSDVASVSGGTVSCKGVGTATITVTTTDGGRQASCTVTVSAKTVAVEKVEITGGTSVKAGETLTLTAKLSPEGATADTITWSTSDSSIASVDAGKVKGLKAGTVTISAQAGGKTGSVQVTVTSAADNKLEAKDMTLTAGETKKADYTAESVSSVSFSVENTKYATVDSSGNIKGIRAGETKYTVSVKYKDGTGASATKKLTVKAAAVKGITLDKTSATLKVGESLKLNPKVDTTGYSGCLWYSSDQTVVSVEEHGGGTIKALKAGKATITVCSSEDTSKKAVCEVTVTSGKDPRNDTTTPLKDKSGRQLYVKDSSGQYRAAVVADYYKADKFYIVNENVQYRYTGWQTIDGKRYYFDKNGNKVTGEQVIQGVKYTFGSDGALNAGSGVLGIDVSKHNGSINWTEVKNSGVSFVIIRCGYRGSATGVLVEDPKFKANIQGAAAAGLKVGIYFFSQAVNRVEAVEEASMTIELIRNYKISYPVFLDVEAAGGRADGLSAAARTEVINAYCQTLKNSGYTAGVYANKTWLNSKINVGSLGGYRIWLAQYAAAPTYNGRYEMWQYSSTGRISGISGNVDLNISYLGY